MRLPAEFLLLVLVALCGFGAVSALLSISVGTAGLLCSSWPKYFALWGQARAVGKLGAWTASLGLSVLNALVAVLAAYGLGVAMRMFSVL